MTFDISPRTREAFTCRIIRVEFGYPHRDGYVSLFAKREDSDSDEIINIIGYTPMRLDVGQLFTVIGAGLPKTWNNQTCIECRTKTAIIPVAESLKDVLKYFDSHGIKDISEKKIKAIYKEYDSDMYRKLVTDQWFLLRFDVSDKIAESVFRKMHWYMTDIMQESISKAFDETAADVFEYATSLDRILHFGEKRDPNAEENYVSSLQILMQKKSGEKGVKMC